MAETQWLEYYDGLTFEVDSDIHIAIDALVLDDFDSLPTITTMALGEDDPWLWEADVRVVSVSDLA